MRKLLLPVLFCSSLLAAQVPLPKITGIAYVRFHTSDPAAAEKFYAGTLGLAHASERSMDIYFVGRSQRIEIDRTPPPAADAVEEEIGFEVSDAPQMMKYLRVHGIAQFHPAHGGFWIEGPEGKRIAFVKRETHDLSANAASLRIIHVGFVATDKDADERFYRDLLGFKQYWSGGPQWNGTEAKRAYLSYQTPDAHEWVEFMLNRPKTMDTKSYGGPNHVALGVVSITEARAQLVKNGWTGDAQPKQGQDGKYQLNLFDPDGTRAELMEFTPSREPCCTPYNQPHPSPADR